MTREQFSNLPLPQKTQLIRREAVFLCERTSKNIGAYLFQMDSFYVEIIYDRDKARFIRVNDFCSTQHLDPYLEMIDLSRLLE